MSLSTMGEEIKFIINTNNKDIRQLKGKISNKKKKEKGKDRGQVTESTERKTVKIQIIECIVLIKNFSMLPLRGLGCVEMQPFLTYTVTVVSLQHLFSQIITKFMFLCDVR